MVRRFVAVAALALAVTGGLAAGAPLKGDGPISIAAAYGSVWVGTGGGTLVRIDAASGRIQTRLLREPLLQYGYVRALAVGFGSVWAGDRWELARVNPSTNRVRLIEGVAWVPGQLGIGAGALWVADNERGIFRVDPRRLRVVARIPAAQGRPSALAAGPAGVWAVLVPPGPFAPDATRVVRRIDLRTNRLRPPVARSKCDFALAVGPSAVWVSDLCAKTVTRIDARTGARGRPIPVGEAAISLAVGQGSVWVLSQGDATVLRVDPRTERIVARIPAPGISIAAGAGAVWVLSFGDGRFGYVRKIDPGSNRVVGAPIRVSGG
jgi:streptogramin lyase